MANSQPELHSLTAALFKGSEFKGAKRQREGGDVGLTDTKHGCFLHQAQSHRVFLSHH